MASPQTGDGYTRIANELLSAIAAHPFSKRQLKVMLVLCRMTYGYNKKEDDLTVTRIAEMAGITRPHASEAISDLHAMNAVLKRDGRHGYLLGIQKNYEKWQTVPKRDTSQNRTHTVPKRDEPRPETGHTKDNPQKTTPKERNDRFDRWYAEYPRKVAKGQARKAFARLNPDDQMLERMIAAVQEQKRSREQAKAAGEWVPEWKHPATWLNAESWDDETETPEIDDFMDVAV